MTGNTVIPDHGTPTGYASGCHGAASCTNHRTGLMTCTEAHIRYQGDYAYRKAVDAGTATAEREVFVNTKPAKATPKKRTRAKLSGPVATTVKRTVCPGGRGRGREPLPIVHGTRNGSLRGCVADCPAPESCTAVRNREQRERYADRKAAGTLTRSRERKNNTNHAHWEHGTRYGATAGCKTVEGCPETAAGRESCVEARRRYDREWRVGNTKKGGRAA